MVVSAHHPRGMEKPNLFGVNESPRGGEVSTQEKDAIVSFEYMKQFMVDAFATYGIPPDRCQTCADVLIEADKRGIHSHGLGRYVTSCGVRLSIQTQ